MPISFSPTGVISCTGIEVGNTGISFTPDYTVKCNSVITNNTGISFSPDYDISCRSATMGNITLSDSGISGLTYNWISGASSIIGGTYRIPDSSCGTLNRIIMDVSIQYANIYAPLNRRIFIFRFIKAPTSTYGDAEILGTASGFAGSQLPFKFYEKGALITNVSANYTFMIDYYVCRDTN